MEFGPIFRSFARNKIGIALLVIEIAFTLAIVLNSLNIIVEQKERMQQDSGLDEEQLLIVEIDHFGPAWDDYNYRRQVGLQDMDILRAMPGVVNATPISVPPLIGGGSSGMVGVMGTERSEFVRAPVYVCDAECMATLGLELVAGRNFTPEDYPTGPGPRPANAIISQDLANALFPNGDALGKVLNTGSEKYPDTVIGIIDHFKTPYGGGPMESRPLFYANVPVYSSGASYIIKVEPGQMNQIYSQIEPALMKANKERIVKLQTMLELKSETYTMNRVTMTTLNVVIVLLMTITGLGLYGMASFSVTRRTKVIGTRRALGARKVDILRYFLLENFMITGFGIGLGLVCAFGLNRLLMTQADGQPLSIMLALAGVALIAAVGLLATLPPALRGLKIPPAIASRTV